MLKNLLSAQLSADDDLYPAGLLTALADMLAELAGQSALYQEGVNHVIVNQIKDRLQSDPTTTIQLSDLESEFSMDRFSITRQFRRHFGTSPHRFLVMRRLALAKQSLLKGTSLADAAVISGFADQSHMTRHFRRAFGIAPGQWLRLVSNTNGMF